jgi:hypothetical protein
MVELFEVREEGVVPTKEALLISPFKEIWERDPSPRHDVAMQEFAYIEFMVSPRKSNPFRDYPIAVKSDKIIPRVFRNQLDWSPDGLVVRGIEVYNEFMHEASVSMEFLDAALGAADTVIEFLKNFDLNERTRSGMPVYKPKDITSALSDARDVIKTLEGLKADVNQELYDKAKTKKDREINEFER